MQALDVEAWDACVLARPITAGGFDATGPYPRLPLDAGADLGSGLEHLTRAGLTSVVMVVDPLCSPPTHDLEQSFSICRPFKTHQIIDRARGPYSPSKHHRYEIRRAHAG